MLVIIAVTYLALGVESGVVYHKFYGRDATSLKTKVNNLATVSSTIKPSSSDPEHSYVEQDYSTSLDQGNLVQDQQDYDNKKDYNDYNYYNDQPLQQDKDVTDEEFQKRAPERPANFLPLDVRSLHEYPARFIKITRTIAVPIPVPIPIHILPVTPLILKPLPLKHFKTSYSPPHYPDDIIRLPDKHYPFEHPPYKDTYSESTDLSLERKPYLKSTEQTSKYERSLYNNKSVKSRPISWTKIEVAQTEKSSNKRNS